MLSLRRNRDFVLLQSGQLFSNLGTASSSIAYPLLVLAVTGSAANAGFVAFARSLPAALFLIPSGVAADRFDRKRLMITADLLRVVAIGGLAAVVSLGEPQLWLMAVAAFVEGTGSALFSASAAGAVRTVVPRHQLPDAAAAQTGRQAAVDLGGPPIGGALFAIGRAVPFVFDAASYALSTVSLLAIPRRFQAERDPERLPLRSRVAEGFRFLWTQPFLRTTALLFGLGNFIGPGLLLSVVVIGRKEGLPPAQIGALTAAFGACVLVGSLMASSVRRRLSPRIVVLLELWTALGIAGFLVWPSVYVLVAGMLPTGLVIPSTNSVVHGYRIAITPDHLLGRAESIRATLSLAIAPLGPLVAGMMLSGTTPRVTIALFTIGALVLAIWGTTSPAIREVPKLDDLAEAAT